MKSFGPKKSCGWEFQSVQPTPFDYPGRRQDKCNNVEPPLAAVFKHVVRHDGIEQLNGPKICLPDTRAYSFDELLSIKQQGTHYRHGMSADVLDQVIIKFEEKLAGQSGNVVVMATAPAARNG